MSMVKAQADTDGNDEAHECQKFVEDLEIDLEQKVGVHNDDNASFWHRFMHTACLCLSLLALGWRNSILGPTLPDLRLIIGEDLSATSWIFTAKSLGGFVGSLCGGYAYDRFNKILLLTTIMVFMGVCAGFVPWCNSLAAMFVIHAAHGLFSIGLDTAATADIVKVWGQKSDSYMQALHGAFSVGTIVSPFICEPFLARHTIIYNQIWNSTETESNRTIVPNNNADNQAWNCMEIEANQTIAPNNDTTDAHHNGATEIYIPYLITMGVCLLAASSFVISRLKFGDVYKNPAVIKTKTQGNISGTCITRKYWLNHRMKVLFTILLAVNVALAVLCEYCFSGFLMTFLITELHWNKTSGSNATSTFWIAFALGRLTGIFVVKCGRLSVVIIVFSIICVIGTVIFWVSVTFNITFLTWASIAVIGYGMSVLFPSIFSWLSENVRSLTGKTCSILFLAVSVGTMTLPKLVGYLMDKHSQLWFVYAMLMLSVTMLLLFIFILALYTILERRQALCLKQNHFKETNNDQNDTM